MRVKVEVRARERRGGTKSVWNQVAADGCGLCCPRNEPCCSRAMHALGKEGGQEVSSHFTEYRHYRGLGEEDSQRSAHGENGRTELGGAAGGLGGRGGGGALAGARRLRVGRLRARGRRSGGRGGGGAGRRSGRGRVSARRRSGTGADGLVVRRAAERDIRADLAVHAAGHDGGVKGCALPVVSYRQEAFSWVALEGTRPGRD